MDASTATAGFALRTSARAQANHQRSGSASGQRAMGERQAASTPSIAAVPRRSLPGNEATRQENPVVVYLDIMDDMDWLFGTSFFTPVRSLLKVSWHENGIACRR